MVTIRPVVLVSALAITALSCAAPTGPASTVVPKVVAAGRDAAGIVYFEVDWRNMGTVPVYLPGCDRRASTWLERRGAGGWEEFGGGICLANLDQTPVRIDPNQSVRSTVRVGPGSEGEYRAVTSAFDVLGGDGEYVRSAGARVP